MNPWEDLLDTCALIVETYRGAQWKHTSSSTPAVSNDPQDMMNMSGNTLLDALAVCIEKGGAQLSHGLFGSPTNRIRLVVRNTTPRKRHVFMVVELQEMTTCERHKRLALLPRHGFSNFVRPRCVFRGWFLADSRGPGSTLFDVLEANLGTVMYVSKA